MFKGIPKSLPGFLAELADNNNRDWFEENRSRYETLAAEPCLALIEELAPKLAAMQPPHKAVAKVNQSLRRIYRDTRFSKDKTPYYTYLHLIFWAGDHPMRSPGLHVIFSPGGLGLGAGYWSFEKAQLASYRTAIADGDKRKRLEDALEVAKDAGCHLESPALKRPPAGLDVPMAAERLARQKGIVVRNRNEAYDDAIFTPDCADYLTGRLENLLGIDRWLMANVFTD